MIIGLIADAAGSAPTVQTGRPISALRWTETSPTLASRALTAFFQMLLIDLALVGDNAIVVGLAARLPSEQRRRASRTVGLVVAANLIARYTGLAVTLWVACKMISDGYREVAPVLGWPAAALA